MKLQKQISRRYKETEYLKYWVVIPKKHIEALGWHSIDWLDTKIKGEKLIIKPLVNKDLPENRRTKKKPGSQDKTA